MSAFKLARWFQPERYANRPEDDFVREEILNEVAQAEAVAVAADKTIYVKTPHGAAAIEAFDWHGSSMVSFDFVSDERWERTSFWMNASSVRDLGDTLRGKPRATVDEIFTGVPA